MISATKMKITAIFIFFSLFTFSAHGFNQSTSSVSPVHGHNRKHYIVYMGSHSYPNSATVMTHNHQLLSSVVGSAGKARKAIVHHYTKSFRGFSALLTPEQVERLRKNNSTISVFESKVHSLHTTRSWDFMESYGINNAKGIFGHFSHDESQDVIVGHLDSGVWPESKSFSDDGLGPVPNHWKGECVTGQRFTKANCNRKIIGARYYYQGWEKDMGPLGSDVTFSPRDDFAHGSHTASTAVGSKVRGINIPGFGGSQTARGGAPHARLAVYKTCWHNRCSCADILKAFDDAIYDGVDIITISVGSDRPVNYLDDCFAMGSLKAFQRGILVAASAGNNGENGILGTVVNIAPWILTVAASTIDRELYSFVLLGNNNTVKGYGLNMQQLDGFHPLVLASDVARLGVNYIDASFCRSNTLNHDLIRGRIVVCAMDRVNDDVLSKSYVVKEGGGVGMILVNQFVDLNENINTFAIPTSVISLDEGHQKLYSYMASTRSPIASILHNHGEVGTKPAPKMATFSSRGPNAITPDIIKPDITAPGVNILAAWIPDADQAVDTLSYHMDSGTSMSCPHVAGVAAVLKGQNRGWSPAEIKSALMTTVQTQDNNGNFMRDRSGENEATPFDLGSGHLNPDQALNPGLVYDFGMNDIANFLCSNGLTEMQVQRLIGMNVACNYDVRVPQYNLNYPSIGVGAVHGPISVFRTVTFKGGVNDPKVYRVYINCPPDVEMQVVPDVLDFSDGSTRASYRVNFLPLRFSGLVYGSITWTDGYSRYVRSPILLNLRGR